MSSLAASGTRLVHGLGAVQPLEQRQWNAKVQRASRVSFRRGPAGGVSPMAVANPDVKPKASQDGKAPDASAVAMETVAKRAPVTADRNVSHKDLPIDNPRKPPAPAPHPTASEML
jgi:hypothetical protein